MKGLGFKEGKELSQWQSQVWSPGPANSWASPSYYHILGVLDSTSPCWVFCLHRASVPMMEECSGTLFCQNLNPHLSPFMFPWTPWTLNQTEAFPTRRSPLESAQATALPRLMAPDCCVMFSSFTHSQLFSDRPASRLITSHIVTQNPDIFTKASRLFVPFQTHVCSLSCFQHLRCPQQLSTFLKENSKLKKKKSSSNQTCVCTQQSNWWFLRHLET